MERAIGEVFQDGEVTLKVVKSHNCVDCHYDIDSNRQKCLDSKCVTTERSDDNQVKFIVQD